MKILLFAKRGSMFHNYLSQSIRFKDTRIDSCRLLRVLGGKWGSFAHWQTRCLHCWMVKSDNRAVIEHTDWWNREWRLHAVQLIRKKNVRVHEGIHILRDDKGPARPKWALICCVKKGEWWASSNGWVEVTQFAEHIKKLGKLIVYDICYQ